MSTIALELDRALQSLDKAACNSLTTIVREAIHLVKSNRPAAIDSPHPADLALWMQRLEARSAQISTGRNGAPLQEVMDDLRN